MKNQYACYRSTEQVFSRTYILQEASPVLSVFFINPFYCKLSAKQKKTRRGNAARYGITPSLYLFFKRKTT